MEEKKHNKELFTKMLVLYLLLVVVGGGAMLMCTINTQVVNGDMWREKARAREVVERIETARRGTIFSSDGKVLATTVPVCDLCLDLGRWPKKNRKGGTVKDSTGRVVMESCITNDSAFKANVGKVCAILHNQFPAKSFEYYYNRIMREYVKPNPSRCLYVERKVPYSQWTAIKRLPGWERCVVTKTAEGSVKSFVRAHIYGNMGENVVGQHYVTKREEGYTGLEGYYDSVLRGQDGKYLCRRLTLGTWIPVEDGSVPDEDSTLIRHRIDGKSIVATIDTRYQDIAESALRRSMNQYGGQSGCAILMEMSTGYVLACSSLTRDTSGRLREMLWSNVACSDSYEPGSTFKTVAMLAMLGDDKISLDTSMRVQSGGRKRYSASSGEIDAGHGYTADTSNLAGVLAMSSNVGMCELAWQFYRNRRGDMKKAIESIFPFGKMCPDLDVLEPRTGIVPLVSDRDFLNLSYGYSATVTPLQVITFYNAVANGGKMVKPLFCREIIDGSRSSAISPVVLNSHICSEETAKQMCEMLIGVVENGTGSNVRNSVYKIGGKTGTTLSIGDRSIKNSSFVGFFPADNPRYTCMVLVERTSIAGRHAAAPVFKKIADCVMAFDEELGGTRLQDSGRVMRPVLVKGQRSQLEMAHHLLGIPFACDEASPSGRWTLYENDRSIYGGYQVPVGVVPDCKGMTIRDALALLRAAGLKVRFSGQGKVINQSPAPRTKVKKGSSVTLELKP